MKLEKDNDVVKQEKTDEELNKKAEEIISLLKNFNYVEKYKIISALYITLIDTIKHYGYAIIEESEK